MNKIYKNFILKIHLFQVLWIYIFFKHDIIFFRLENLVLVLRLAHESQRIKKQNVARIILHFHEDVKSKLTK